jgi:2-oxoglutarate ferredoxin oxidoreductase subunit alpha
VRNDITIRIAGEGGEGVISTAEILTRAAVDSGLDAFTFRSYPAEIKGGLAMMQVRMATSRLDSIGRDADVLMAFNQEAIDVWGDRMSPGGILLYDPRHGTVPAEYPFVHLPIPLHETAMKETGARIAKNIVALASMVSVLDIPPQYARELIVKQFKRKGEEVIATNLKAFDAGLTVLNGDPRLMAMKLARPAAPRPADRVIISGNQSLSMGAVAAGCRFVAGYPITPATQVLEFMMKHLPAFGGNVIQCEDEIAAIAACLGASWAGSKSMTATSGPGLCLMSELIGMASMCEIPVVIADVMRSGPATGMPTKTEQADLMYAVHGSAGESPRIVIAATSVENCFYDTIRAFNLAERFQMPVILLSDQSMGYRTKTVERPRVDNLRIEERVRAGESDLEDFRRFADTESGVSPTVVPGSADASYVTSGLEHDEWGRANYTPENRARMVAKRYRKLDTLRRELEAQGDGVLDVPAEAEIGIVGWGSTEGTITEVVSELRAGGLPVAHYHPKVLHPLPVETVRRFIEPLKKVIVLEENHTGQFAQHLRAHVDFRATEVVRVNQCSGLPFTPDEVRAAISAHA